MEREIVVRLKVPAVPGLKGRIAAIVALLLAAAVVRAAGLNLFGAKDPVGSAAINQNFKYLDDRITAATTLTNNGHSISLRPGRVCGYSAPTAGNIGSYPAAKALCEAACTATAHVCSSEEILALASIGVSINANVWYQGGQNTGAGPYMSDCVGWKTNDVNNQGHTWNGSYPMTANCQELHPLACCDYP